MIAKVQVSLGNKEDILDLTGRLHDLLVNIVNTTEWLTLKG